MVHQSEWHAVLLLRCPLLVVLAKTATKQRIRVRVLLVLVVLAKTTTEQTSTSVRLLILVVAKQRQTASVRVVVRRVSEETTSSWLVLVAE